MALAGGGSTGGGAMSRMRRPLVAVAVLVALLGAVAPAAGAAASTTTGTLTGTILGLDGAPLAGVYVAVLVNHPSQGCTHGAKIATPQCLVVPAAHALTRADGTFSVTVKTGAYTFQVDPGAYDGAPNLTSVTPVPGPAGVHYYLTRWYRWQAESTCFGGCITLSLTGHISYTVPTQSLLTVSAGQTTTALPTTLTEGGVLGGQVHPYRGHPHLPDVLLVIQDPRQGDGYAQIAVTSTGALQQAYILPAGSYQAEDTSQINDPTTTTAGARLLGVSLHAWVVIRAGAVSTLTVSGAPPKLVSPVIAGPKKAGAALRLVARWSLPHVAATCHWSELSRSVGFTNWQTSYGSVVDRGGCNRYVVLRLPGVKTLAVAATVSGYQVKSSSSALTTNVTWQSTYRVISGRFP